MTSKSFTERFVIEFANDDGRYEDRVTHIADTEKPVKDEEFLRELYDDPDRERTTIRKEQILCSRGNWYPYAEDLSLEEAAETFGFEKTEFSGEAPDAICNYCWKSVLDEIESLENRSDTVHDKIGDVGYRLRWKQKRRARDEWYDIIVKPETTMEEVDRLVTRFTTLHNGHLRLYGLEGEYMDSSIAVLPDRQYEVAGNHDQMKASNITIGEVAEKATLWEGDRLSLAFDLATPSHFYCIVKEVLPPAAIDDMIESEETIRTTDTAAIIKEKRP